MKYTSSSLLLVLALSACAADTDNHAANDPARAALPDKSGTVESVHGEDPKRYYIANLPALNAVDKDGNGLWDDIEVAVHERMQHEPAVIQNMDMRPVWQVARHFQQTMQYQSQAEARANSIDLYAYSLACLDFLVKSKQLPATVQVGAASKNTIFYVADIATQAVMTSKERVLASTYADMLSSGGVYPNAPVGGDACTK
jgi:hypothetical protein